MKKFKLCLLLVALTFSGKQSFSEEIKLTEGKETKITITENNYSSLRLTNSIANLNYFNVKTISGIFSQITVDGYGYSMEIGDPKLPVLKKVIEVPIGSYFEINIIKENYLEYDLSDFGIYNKIIPAQPSVSKSIDNPEDLEFIINQSTYQTNDYLSSDLVTVNYLGKMRGVSMARVEISPFQYNPVLNKIKVCYELEVEINFIGGDLNKTIQLKKDLFSPYFEGVYNLIANYKEEITDELIMDEPVTFIIVSDPMFQAALQPYIEWKTKKGFYVIEAYTDDPAVGNTTTSIKSYLQDLYNNPPAGYNSQSFVLLVGDVAQIPAFNGTAGGHITDLYYCEYTGDIFPECYYGRFSANNLTELQPQIDKTLEYEQYLMPDPSFLDKVVMVAGADAYHQLTWGNGQINYGTTYYFNAAHGIYSHTYLQPEPSGGNYSANIRQNVSDGVAYANYTAHCSSSGWANPNFVTSHIPALTNSGKYPLMIGNCCSSATFGGTCFAEELLRAVDKGALGYIGGSNSTYWDEDFWWGVGYEAISSNPVYNASHLGAYDRTFHDNGEPLSEWYVTQGQMPSAGNLAVTQAGSNLETYYWEIYHLMGDPSLMVYMSQPPVTSATYDVLMPLGTTSFTVNTEAYAYVGITKDGVLHGAAIADASGIAEVTMNPPITVPGTADIVVTRQNGQPYIGTVTVVSAGFDVSLSVLLEGPFNGSDMNTDLIAVPEFPLTQPFNTAPWNYTGTETVTVLPNSDIVDWVLVELRDAANAGSATDATIIATQAGFLLNNGVIVSLDGTSPLFYSTTISQNLFVTIYCRNHLAILSDNPLTNIGGVYTYNFSTGPGQVYGGSAGYNELVSGIWGMVGGDGNCDGEITIEDKTGAWEPDTGNSGYNINDHNLDGQIDNRDKNDYILLNIGKESQVPE